MEFILLILRFIYRYNSTLNLKQIAEKVWFRHLSFFNFLIQTLD